NRFDVFTLLVRDRLFAVEPDLVIGGGLRTQMFRDPGGERLHLVADAVVPDGSRAAHDVSLNVSTGRQRRYHRRVQLTQVAFQIVLEDAVHLDALPAGQA